MNNFKVKYIESINKHNYHKFVNFPKMQNINFMEKSHKSKGRCHKKQDTKKNTR